MKLEELFTPDELALINSGGYYPENSVLDAKLHLYDAIKNESSKKNMISSWNIIMVHLDFICNYQLRGE